MSPVRVTLIAAATFFTPVLLVLTFASRFAFLHAGDDVRSQQYPSALTHPPRDERKAENTLPTDQPYALVPSSAELDPQTGNTFLVSVKLRISAIPAIGERQKLISKFVSSRAPYPGWALALRRTETSLRAEVYMRSEKGSGGWYSFGDVPIEAGATYAFQIVAVNGETLRLFAEKLATKGADQVASEQPTVQFLGGYRLKSSVQVATAADLAIGNSRVAPTGPSADVKGLLVARFPTVHETTSDLLELLRGGPESIAERIPAGDVLLSVNSDLRDQSTYNREVRIAPTKS